MGVVWRRLSWFQTEGRTDGCPVEETVSYAIPVCDRGRFLITLCEIREFGSGLIQAASTPQKAREKSFLLLLFCSLSRRSNKQAAARNYGLSGGVDEFRERR